MCLSACCPALVVGGRSAGPAHAQRQKEDPPPTPAPPGQQRPNRLDLPKGARTRDDEKKPLCFGYSRGTCPHQDKEKCSRGHPLLVLLGKSRRQGLPKERQQ